MDAGTFYILRSVSCEVVDQMAEEGQRMDQVHGCEYGGVKAERQRIRGETSHVC